MNYQDFLDTILSKMLDYYGEGNVKISQIQKNNGVVLDGLLIMEPGRIAAPTIYLNDFYNIYEKEKNINKVLKKILDLYESNKTIDDFDPDFILDLEKVKKRIAYKLINTEKNKELLKNVPHRETLDLSFVYYCMIASDTFGKASFLVHNDQMKLWGIQEEQLYELAQENSVRLLKPRISRMEDILLDLAPEGFEIQQLENGEDSGMYIITNLDNIQGAVCVYYPNVLPDFAKKLQSDLFLLPSSIHEMILVPAKNEEQGARLRDIVREINQTEVEEEDVLSNLVYFYSREDQQIRILN